MPQQNKKFKPSKKAAAKTDDIKKELKELQRQIKSNIKAAWESSEKQKAQEKVNKSVDSLVSATDKLVTQVKTGQLTDKVKFGFYKSLKTANKKLRRTKKVWTPKGDV